jgi:hypothetical protein
VFKFIEKVSRSINFSSLFYVFALFLSETLHSIKNLAVHILDIRLPENFCENFVFWELDLWFPGQLEVFQLKGFAD